MKSILNWQVVSRFETVLGFGLLALVILFVLPPLQVGLMAERPMRTVLEAEVVARAVLDYHTDQGKWPIARDGQTDLAMLVTTPAADLSTAGSLFGTVVDLENPPEKSWLKEVPVDPWNHPYRLVVVDGPIGTRSLTDFTPSSGYPDTPPPGTAIIVISAGPNGLFDTDLAPLWKADLSGRLEFLNDLNTPSGNSFGGDDLVFVLARATLGGNK